MSATGGTAGGRLLRQGSVYTVANALKLAAAALAIPIATRLLDVADYGVVTLATTLQLLLATLATLGLQASILRFFYDEGDGPATARALIAGSTLVALVVTAVVAGCAALWTALGLGDTFAVLFGAALALPTAVVGSCMSMLRAQGRPVAFVTVVLLSTVGAQALAVAGLAVEAVPATYLIGVLVASTAAMVAGLLMTRAVRVRLPARRILRSALAYGLPTVPHSVSIFALALGDRIVVAAMNGPSAVGRYQVAFALGFLGVLMVQSLQIAWVPLTFASSDAERWQTLAEIAGTVARLAGLACGFIALTAEPVLSVLVPGGYSPHLLGGVAAVAALATVAWATFLARTQVLLWTKRTRALSWITPSTAALNLGLVAALLPPFGLRGAAAATVVAALAQAGLIGRAVRRVASVPWRRRPELVAYGIAAVCVALALGLPASGWGLAVRLAAAAVAAVAFARALAGELGLARRAAASAALGGGGAAGDERGEPEQVLELG